jgi:indolepyruvate ferredoxin oxidoreductase beta subunit
VVLLGALSALLPVEVKVWQEVLGERVPSRYLELNLKAFSRGREWMKGVKDGR